jgi:hypothetical protein
MPTPPQKAAINSIRTGQRTNPVISGFDRLAYCLSPIGMNRDAPAPDASGLLRPHSIVILQRTAWRALAHNHHAAIFVIFVHRLNGQQHKQPGQKNG